MGSKGFMWHVAQIFQILAAGAWAIITCLIPAFTIPRDTTSHNNVDATGRRRSYILALWVGTALAWFFFAAGIIFYIALILAHRRAHKRGSSRNCTVWITTGFRVLGAVAGIALGAYYVHRRLKRIYPALSLAFIFAFACIVAVFFTITRRQKAHVVQRGHIEKGHHRDGVLPTGHHQQRRGWRSRF